MVELKREYVVPLRRKTKLAPKWRRSKKAVTVLNEFIQKHMKTDNVIICNELNEEIWKHGIKNPPGKVNVIALKTDINGVEKTLVNLANVGIDTQLKQYKTTTTPAAAPATEEAKAEDKKEEVVKDAEVKEVKKETKKAAAPKKTEDKKEAKK